MNKKQEAASWLVAITFVFACLEKDRYYGDWFYELAIPIVVVGFMLVHLLRTRNANQPSMPRSAAVLAIPVVALALADWAERSESLLDQIVDTQSTTQSDVSDLISETESILGKVDNIDDRTDSIEAELRYR